MARVCRRSMWFRLAWIVLLVFQSWIGLSSAFCTLDDLECCLTSFGNLINPSGLKLSRNTLENECKIKDDALSCMEVYAEQCNATDEVNAAIGKSSQFLDDACLPTSEFSKNLQDNEECILNSSAKFQSCYNQSELPDKTKTEDNSCCSYKAVRDCAVQTVEDRCGAVASQVVHEQVQNTNGVVLEWFCKDKLDRCGNSAVVLASSALFVFLTLASHRLLI